MFRLEPHSESSNGVEGFEKSKITSAPFFTSGRRTPFKQKKLAISGELARDLP